MSSSGCLSCEIRQRVTFLMEYLIPHLHARQKFKFEYSISSSSTSLSDRQEDVAACHEVMTGRLPAALYSGNRLNVLPTFRSLMCLCVCYIWNNVRQKYDYPMMMMMIIIIATVVNNVVVLIQTMSISAHMAAAVSGVVWCGVWLQTGQTHIIIILLLLYNHTQAHCCWEDNLERFSAM